MQHSSCSAFVGTRVALEAFLPIPASCCDVGRGDEVVAIVAHVLFVLQLLAVLFLQEVDRAIRRRDIPADLRLFLHVVTQESPQSLAEDHVLEVGNLGEDVLGKGVRNGTHEERVPGLSIDDALENVVPLYSDSHEEKLRREFSLLSSGIAFVGPSPSHVP